MHFDQQYVNSVVFVARARILFMQFTAEVLLSAGQLSNRSSLFLTMSAKLLCKQVGLILQNAIGLICTVVLSLSLLSVLLVELYLDVQH